MGFPTELRKLWNKQMWDRKRPPLELPSNTDKTDTWKELNK